MIYKNLLAATALVMTLFVFSGCAPKMMTKGEAFPKMYDEHPKSLLILPPMNESTDAEAKDYYMTTIEMPFALMGYYTFPVEMVSDIMKQEGAYDTELIYNTPLNTWFSTKMSSHFVSVRAVKRYTINNINLRTIIKAM